MKFEVPRARVVKALRAEGASGRSCRIENRCLASEGGARLSERAAGLREPRQSARMAEHSGPLSASLHQEPLLLVLRTQSRSGAQFTSSWRDAGVACAGRTHRSGGGGPACCQRSRACEHRDVTAPNGSSISVIGRLASACRPPKVPA